MPATDQTWRDQKVLHIVFAATSVLMLIATLLLLGADHRREWKGYQRTARKIENTLTEWRINEAGSANNERERARLEREMAAASAAAVPQALLAEFAAEAAEGAKFRGLEFDPASWDAQQESLAKQGEVADADRAKADAALEQFEAAKQAAIEAKRALDVAQEANSPKVVLEPLQATLDTALQARDSARTAWQEAQNVADVSSAAAAKLRRKLVGAMQDTLDDAKLWESNVLSERKFMAARYDEARAKLDIKVRDSLPQDFDAAQAEIDRVKAELDAKTLEREFATLHRSALQTLMNNVTADETALKKAVEANEAEYNQLVASLNERKSQYFSNGLPGKKWLELPILDGFNSPLKIDNKWTKGLTQPMGSFGQVRRFDRCTTCHKMIDKTMAGSATEPAYQDARTIHLTLTAPEEAPEPVLDDEGNALPRTLEQVFGFSVAETGLVQSSEATVSHVVGESLAAKAALDHADAELADPGLQVGDVVTFVNDDEVTYPGQVHEMLIGGLQWGESFRLTVRRGLPEPFASHPRLDLFVGSLSPHKMSVMACTVCHEGQGSATEFKFVSHSPSDPEQAREWSEKYGWFNNHHWIYPMYPARFAESACLKCHHTVEELAPSERFPEPPAPKVMAGFTLIKRYGCFGCHEINGYETAQKTLGPDLRLEPNFFAAALQLKADPGFGNLDEQLQQKILSLATDPTLNETRREIRDFILADAKAEEPMLTRTSHQLDEVLKDVDIPGQYRKTGPSLRYVGSKLGEQFMYDWIEQPNRYRPSTRMPQFFGHLAHIQADLQAGAAKAVAEIADSAQLQGLAHAEEIRQLAQQLKSSAGHELSYEQRSALRSQLLQDRDALLEAGAGQDAAVAGTIARVNQWADALADAAEVFEPIEVLGMTNYLLGKSQSYEYLETPDGLADADAEQIERGKEAFELRGCLACHSHGDFPNAASDRGPDLTNIGDKLKASAGAPNGAAWLYTWIRQPSHYNVRTIMPDLFLEAKTNADGEVVDPAADITAYLLSSSNDWQPVATPQPALRDLDQFVLENLRQLYPLSLAQERLVTGIPEAEAPSLKGAEVELVGEMTVEKKLLYVGRKAIGKYGCYGCHDVPGFENGKPIGTGLADWGRKETAKLAFEHIAEYMHEHGHGHGGAHGGAAHAPGAEGGHDAEQADSQDSMHAAAEDTEPFDTAYYDDQLMSGERVGFIWQKLKEPRSYDYKKTRNKRYDERLRMPLFPLTDMEREEVITFVLGLVADPPAEEFTYRPNPRQQAIVDGLHVLYKFNCAGCHILETERWMLEFEPGTFDEQSESVDFPFMTAHLPQAKLAASLQADPRRGVLNAEVRGLPYVNDSEGAVEVWSEDEEPLSPEEVAEQDPQTLIYPFNLWEPAAIEGNTYQVGVSPLFVPGSALKKRYPTVGGDLTWLLLPRVLEKEQEETPAAKGSEAFGWLPPALVGEGVKVQPDWLHSFLLDPYPIRPAVFLRMPKFNMSADDATKLVNYFAARDNANYPFEYTQRTSTDYLQMADAKFDAGSGSGTESSGAPMGHLGHAMQIVTSADYCIKCHLVGDFVVKGGDRALAPNLANVKDRLRPEYIRKWIANPKKILPYTSMPQNIPYQPDAENLGGVAQTLYPGTSIEQVDSLVDLLMNYDEFLASRTSIAELVEQAAAGAAPAGANTPEAGADAAGTEDAAEDRSAEGTSEAATSP
jgi:cbb3-type cytochrome oxidase cytochrome c subunit